MVDVMRKSFLKYILENWSDFLINGFVFSHSRSKVSELIASCHLKYNVTWKFSQKFDTSKTQNDQLKLTEAKLKGCMLSLSLSLSILLPLPLPSSLPPSPLLLHKGEYLLCKLSYLHTINNWLTDLPKRMVSKCSRLSLQSLNSLVR